MVSRLSAKACAVHEAGHLFASLALDSSVLIDSVWIERTSGGQWQGKVERRRYLDEWEANRSRLARIEVLVSLAGPVAETRWRLRGRWAATFAAAANAEIAASMRYEASDDFGQAVEQLEWLGADDLCDGFRVTWIEAEELLHKHWPALVRFADMLKERQRIGAKELFALPEVQGVLSSVKGAV